MIICPKCQRENQQGAARCFNCGELLLEDNVPKKRFPIGMLFLMELGAFIMLLFCIVLIVSIGDFGPLPLLYLFLADALAIAGIIIPILVYRKRRKNYKRYLERLELQRLRSQKAEQEAKGTPEEEDHSICYLDTLKAIDAQAQAHPLHRTYNDNVTLEDAHTHMQDFFAANGLALSPDSARSLLVAMASSRLVYLDLDPDADREAFVRTLNKYFGFGAHVTSVQPDWSSTYALLGQKPLGSLNNRGTGVLVDLYFTKYAENNICYTFLDNVDPNAMSPYMADFERYIANPQVPYMIHFRNTKEGVTPLYLNGNGRSFMLPSNFWFFCFVAPGTILSPATKDIYQKSTVVRMDIHATEAAPDTTPSGLARSYSYNHFITMINQAYESYLLPESVWVKWDRLKAYFNGELGMKVGNSHELALENLSSLYMSIFPNHTDNQALDFALRIHLLTATRVACGGDPDKIHSLLGIIEETFGEGEIVTFSQAMALSIPVAEVPKAPPAEAPVVREEPAVAEPMAEEPVIPVVEEPAVAEPVVTVAEPVVTEAEPVVTVAPEQKSEVTE